MARPELPAVPAVLLLAVALVLALPGAASSSKQPAEPSPTRGPPLLDCSPAPPVTAPDGSTFRANLLSLLRDIPSVAAAAPGGFVSAHSGRAGRDLAFARALCFGAAANRSSTTAACRACLSAAASDATVGCGGSRRAGVWRAGCFLAYADTHALSAREAAFRGWYYAAGPTSTAAAATLERGVCVSDHTGTDCGRCFEDAARAAAALRWLVRMWGEEVIVVGYACSLRVRISVLPMRSASAIANGEARDIRQFFFALWILIMVGAESAIVTLLFVNIIGNLGDIPQPIQ